MKANRGKAGLNFQAATKAKLEVMALDMPGFYFFEIPDGIKPVYRRGQGVVGMRAAAKTPADFAFSYQGKTCGFIECKSTNQPRLPISKSGIKPHQIETLRTLDAFPFNMNTYLLWQCLEAKSSGVWIIPGRRLIPEQNRKSFSLDFAKEMGLYLGEPWDWDLKLT